MQWDFSTCDWCDAHRAERGGAFRVLPPVFRHYGGCERFAGPVWTVQCHEDNTPVKAAVEAPGAGRVLVVDAGASLRRAVLGGNLAQAAARNGWAGVVVDGCVRDVAELRASPLGICALAHTPMPTERRHPGASGIPVQIQGVWIRPGEWLYADADGIVISPEALHPTTA